MKIGIGIDTGGTYTDAVVYDFENKEVLGCAKALTTKEDLSIGILGALDELSSDLIENAELISLSTTLATNACVEDKGGSAKLIFFNGDSKTIDEMGGKYGLPTADDIYIQKSYTAFSGEMEREPDWEMFNEGISQGFELFDGVGIVEMNAMKNGAFVEKKAKRLFEEKFDIPVVCGHELFSELNCLQRASSTLLNARLFPVIKEFLEAIKVAMTKRNIHAAVVIVRSDGSLMSEKFAKVRPVETLLCGPAASVIGSTQLTKEADNIIVDMGGTTTDIALMKNHVPVVAVGGVSIGKWKTFVEGLYVKTFGLGGDSAIHYKNKALLLEPYRVMPLCVAAAKYPVVIDNLRKLVNNNIKHTKFLHEHYILIKDISNHARYTAEEKDFCNALKNQAFSLREAPKMIGKDMYNINVSSLKKEGVIQMCGLTPTDIMHIKKDFVKYSSEASLLGAQYVASQLEITVDELCDMVYDKVKRKIYRNIVEVMLENKNPYYMKNGVSKDAKRLIDESYEDAKNGKKDRMISMMFHTDFSLIGIGAPIKVFLDDVAEMLGTKAVIPKHFEVANALGAIVGNVRATHTIEMRPNYDIDGITGYTVYGNVKNEIFKNKEEAEEFAVSEAKHGAKAEAISRGAQGNITVTYTLDVNEAPAKECTLYLGSMVTAYAVGAIGF